VQRASTARPRRPLGPVPPDHLSSRTRRKSVFGSIQAGEFFGLLIPVRRRAIGGFAPVRVLVSRFWRAEDDRQLVDLAAELERC
jgi:hypothetical protein